MGFYDITKDAISVLTPILVAMIGGGVTVWISKIQHARKKLKKENEDLQQDKTDLSMGIEFDLQTFNWIHQTIQRVFEETNFDSFLVMTAMNGQREFRFVSAIYEQYSNSAKVSMGATGKYMRFEFDLQYREVIKSLETAGELDFLVWEMPESDLKNMFIADGVAESKLVFVARAKMNDNNDRIFFFVLTTKTGVNAQDKLKARAYISGIKDIIKSSITRNNGQEE